MVKQDNPKNITFNLGGNIPVEGGKIKRGRKKKVIEPTEVFVKEKLPSQKFSRKKNPALDQLLEANREKERIAVEKAVRDMVVKQTKSQNIYGYGMKGRGADSDDEEDPESFNLYEELNKNPIDNIPQFGNLTLKIPPFFAVPTNNNESAYWKLVNPLTEIRNLATRKQKLSVNIKRANVKKPELVDMSVPRNAPRIEDFSPKDQAKLKAYMEAVKQGKEQEYLFKNKPRGFPAVLYKNAKKAGLKETKEKVYTKNKVKKAPAPKGARGRPKKGRKVLEIEGEEDDDGPVFDPNDNDLAVDTTEVEEENGEKRLMKKFDEIEKALKSKEIKKSDFIRIHDELKEMKKEADDINIKAVQQRWNEMRKLFVSTQNKYNEYLRNIREEGTLYEGDWAEIKQGLKDRFWVFHSRFENDPDKGKAEHKKLLTDADKFMEEIQELRKQPRFKHTIKVYYDGMLQRYNQSVRDYNEKYHKKSGKGLSYKMEGEGDKETKDDGGCDGEGSAGSLLGKIGKKVYNTLVKPRVEAVQKNIQRITHPKETLQEAKDFGKNLIYGRNNAYPPSIQKIIDANKDAIVQSVSLRRTPLSSAYTTILSFATKGETAKRIKEQPKDTLYHIAMWVGLSNGKTIKVEKNEVINMVVNPKRPKEEQVLALTNVPANLTFGDMLSKTREEVGDHKFFSYSAKDNNCGNFIEYILKTNGMNNEATNDYIGQDAKAILKGFPSLRKVMNTLTDTAGRANVLLEGGGVSDSDRDYSDSEEEEMEDLEGGSILANQQKKLSNGNYIDMRNHIGHPALMSDLYPRIPQAFTQVHLAHPSPIGSGLYASSGGSLLDNIYGGARHMLGVGLVDKIGRKLDPRRNGAVKLANKTFTPRMGRNIASTLIKDGVPAVVGGVSGATTTALTGNPALGIAVGAVARKYGGNRARDAIGDATGYGMVRNNVRRMSGYGIPDPPSRSPITDPSLLGSGMSKGCGMKGRFVKGSQEAKDYMASIRKKR